ncbi:MAG: anaerobic ribonucleoside-triphosphate reductase activating protein, partial [Candidatus Nealsonbacteria bacterium]|nr:anaerobic ribonucleoside-triphosphate reductase activating protein [Candidatus Nealsonbacteria bacterium]
MMRIGGLQKTTLIDYPGRLAATLFLTGCNFRCPFCYSSELVLPDRIKKQPRLAEDEFFAFLKERKGFLEGVVICGGEPTINKDLPPFISKIKDMGFLVKLDTNGSNPKMLRDLIEDQQIDYVAMDIKVPKEKYVELVGEKAVGNIGDKIEDSINILKNSNIEFEFRTTLVPGLLDKEEILKIVHWIRPAPKYFLQNYRGEKTVDPKFSCLKPYPEEYLLDIRK